MDEAEFLGEKVTIGVIPNFNFDPIHLISNTIGEYYFSDFILYRKQFYV